MDEAQEHMQENKEINELFRGVLEDDKQDLLSDLNALNAEMALKQQVVPPQQNAQALEVQRLQNGIPQEKYAG